MKSACMEARGQDRKVFPTQHIQMTLPFSDMDLLGVRKSVEKRELLLGGEIMSSSGTTISTDVGALYFMIP